MVELTNREGVLLAAHGTFPWDFIKKNPRLWSKHEENLSRLMDALLEWPRTPQNDPHWFEMKTLAEMFKEKTKEPIVEPAFMFATRPTILDSIRSAVEQGAQKIVAIPPFINVGPHTLMDIPKQFERAKKAFPDIEMVYYPPPYDTDDMADLLLSTIKKFKNPMRW